MNNQMLTASHHTIGTPTYSIEIYSDQYKEFHLFVKIQENTSIDILFTSNKEPVYAYEGINEFPDGNTSNFDKYVWNQTYTTILPKNSNVTFGTINSDTLFVSRDAQIGSDLKVTDSITCSKINYNKDVFIIGQNNDITITENDIFCKQNLLPHSSSGSSGSNLGSIDNTWKNVFTDSMNVKSINITDKLNIPNVISLNNGNPVVFFTSVLIKNDVNVTGSFEVQQNITTEKDIISKQNIYGNDLFITNKVNSDSIDSKSLTIEGLSSLNGDLLLTGNIISPSNVLQIKATACKLGNNIIITQDGSFIQMDKEFVINVDSKDFIKIHGNNGISLKSAVSIEGKVTFSESVSMMSPVSIENDLNISGNLNFGSIDSKITVDSQWKENVVLQIQNESLQLCVPGSYSGAGLSNPTPRLIIQNTGAIEIPGSLKCIGNSIFSVLQVSQLAEIEKLSLGDIPSPISSVLSINRKSNDNVNLYMCSETGNNYVDDTEKSLIFSMDGGKTAKFTNDGLLQIKNIDAQSLTIENNLSVNNGINIQSSLISCDTSSINFGKNLTLENTGGGVSILAAGNIGMQIEAITGNCSLQGKVFISSSLEYDSVKSSEVITAALNIAGGIVSLGSIYTKKSIVIGGSVVLNANMNSTNYELFLPDTLPTNSDQCLISDVNGQLSWKQLESSKDPVVYGDISDIKQELETIKQNIQNNIDSNNDPNNTIVCKSLQCEDTIQCSNIILNNVSLPRIKYGRVQIGTSSRQYLGLKLTYEHPLDTNKYNIVGNIVSAEDTSLVYSCTFKMLTRVGCNIIIYVLNDTRWKDTSLYLHYYIMW
jgi:hypothetical protein